MSLSAEQMAALDLARPIFLSASAGSGKTRVLVARWLWALEQSAFDVGSVAAVTFTTKAAAEISGRIRAEVAARARDGDAATRRLWRDVRDHLPEAWISTIHGFAARLLANVGPAGGMAAARTIVSGVGEAARLDEVVSRTIDAVADDRSDPDREHVAALLSGFSRQSLIDRLADLVRCRERSEAWAQAVLDPERGVRQQEVIATEFLATRAVETSPRKRRARKTGVAAGSDDGGTAPSSVKIPGEVERGLRAVAHLLVRVLEAYRSDLAVSGTSDFHRLLEDLRAVVHRGGAGGVPRFRHVLVDEFQDTDPLQWEILRGLFGGDRLERPGLCVVGDEKQSIFSFRDGDVATFRRVGREIAALDRGPFAGVRPILPPHAAVAANVPVTGILELRDNYRSTHGIVTFANRVARRLFEDEPAEIFEARFQEAVPKRAVETLVPTRIEIATFLPGEDSPRPRDRELAWVAARAGRFVREATLVHRREGECGDVGVGPARFSDQAILLRGRTVLEELERALTDAGVPFQVLSGVGLYARHEVRVITNLVRFFVDDRDDVSLLGVLRSPLIGLPDSVLLAAAVDEAGAPEVRTLWGRVTRLCDAVVQGRTALPTASDSASLRDGVARLRRWRSLAGRVAPHELLSLVVRESDLPFILEAADPSGRSASNVARVLRIVGDLQRAGEASLVAVARALERAGDNDSEPQADPPAEGRNAVSILTVHAAKGREWPIVFVPDCGGGLVNRPSDAQRPIRMHRDRPGEAPLLALPELEATDEPGTLTSVVRARAREEKLAESKRLLYVALTRARDHLVVSGSAVGNARDIHADSWLRWVRDAADDAVIAAVAASAEPRAHCEVLPDPPLAPMPPRSSPSPIIDPISEAASPRAVDAHRARRSEAVAVPATSFSDLRRCARRFYLDTVAGLAEDRRPEPAHAAESDGARRRVDGRTRGLVVHAAFEGLATGADPSSLVPAAAARFGVVGAEAIDELSEHVRLALEGFRRWPLGARILAAAPRGVETEVPFIFGRGTTRVHGVMDLVFREPGRVYVIDYKTESPATEAKARSLARADGYVDQLSVYAAAVGAASAEPVEAWLFFTGSGIPLAVTCHGGVQADLGPAEVERTLDELSGTDVSGFVRTSDAQLCATCSHRSSGACEGAEERRGGANERR